MVNRVRSQTLVEWPDAKIEEKKIPYIQKIISKGPPFLHENYGTTPQKITGTELCLEGKFLIIFFQGPLFASGPPKSVCEWFLITHN